MRVVRCAVRVTDGFKVGVGGISMDSMDVCR